MAQRTGIMLAYTWDRRRFERYKKPCIVQPKINGNRCRAICNGREVKLLSSSAAEIVSMQHIVAELEAMNLEMELDGELYQHGVPHQITNGLCKRQYYERSHDSVEYWIFDYVAEAPQYARTEFLNNLDLFPMVHVGQTYVETLDELEFAYTNYLEQGFEGIIIREPTAPYLRKKTTSMMKLKPRLSEIYPIVGYEQERSITGSLKDSLGALVLQNDEGLTFRVGSGFTRNQREHYWQIKETLPGRLCKIRYQELSPDLIPLALSFETLLEV